MRNKERQYIKDTFAFEWGCRIVAITILCLGAYALLESLKGVATEGGWAMFLSLGPFGILAGVIWFVLNEMQNRGIMEPRGSGSIRKFLKEATECYATGDYAKAEEFLRQIREFQDFYFLDLPPHMEEKIYSLKRAVR